MADGAEVGRPARSEVLQVGDWSVEPALNQLSRAGNAQKLEPKAMAVLLYLAERPREVVRRETLLAALWPGAVVGDDSLTQAIIKLRKALGDSAESPLYIQTIAKGGYRLVAPVARRPDVSGAETARPPDARLSRNASSLWLIGAAIGALTIAAIAAWLLSTDASDPLPGVVANAETTRAAQPTITVSPLEARSDDQQATLVAQGLTADLATNLSTLAGLTVISAERPGLSAAAGLTTATMTARYVLSGSVQRAGDRLRLHLHLGDNETGRQVWSERFDRSVTDLFALQDELTARILQVLPAKVTEAELRRIAQHHTRDLLAYEYFQRGQMALLVRQRAENETAREMFRRAIELDPKFARAYAALALTYAADYRNQWTADGATALTRAFELARTAHEINPEVRETYWVLAVVHLERRQLSRALSYLHTAVRLSPSFADAYALMAGIYVYTGRAAEALPLMRIALRLNPDGGHLYFLILGRAYFALQDFEQSRLNLDHALLRNPVNLEARLYMAALHLLTGNKTDAQWEAEEIRVSNPGFSSEAWLATHPLTDQKVHAKLVASFKELGL
jgi:DNA-binding winged helix-turn-helix (wHTH) protein/TolB-like protein/Tfp pilus assembly protein PilF